MPPACLKLHLHENTPSYHAPGRPCCGWYWHWCDGNDLVSMTGFSRSDSGYARGILGTRGGSGLLLQRHASLRGNRGSTYEYKAAARGLQSATSILHTPRRAVLPRHYFLPCSGEVFALRLPSCSTWPKNGHFRIRVHSLHWQVLRPAHGFFR